MTVVILVAQDDEIGDAVEELYPNNYKFGDSQWVIATPDLTRTVSDKVYVESEVGGFVVFSINGYYGYHDKDLWEFIARNES